MIPLPEIVRVLMVTLPLSILIALSFDQIFASRMMTSPPLRPKAEGKEKGLVKGKNRCTVDNDCCFCPFFIVPDGISAHRSVSEAGNIVGCGLIDHNLEAVFDKRTVNFNRGFSRDGSGGTEFAVFKFHGLQSRLTALAINQHGFSLGFKGAVLEQYASCTISPNVVVYIFLHEGATDKFHVITIQELLTGDGAILVSQRAGMLKSVVIRSAEVNGYPSNPMLSAPLLTLFFMSMTTSFVPMTVTSFPLRAGSS